MLRPINKFLQTDASIGRFAVSRVCKTIYEMSHSLPPGKGSSSHAADALPRSHATWIMKV